MQPLDFIQKWKSVMIWRDPFNRAARAIASECFLGHWLKYDAPAARDAEQKLRAFLAAHLGSAPSTKRGIR
jgi:hypothetical protein